MKEHISEKVDRYHVIGIKCAYCGGYLVCESCGKYNTITCEDCGIGTYNEDSIEKCLEKIRGKHEQNI